MIQHGKGGMQAENRADPQNPEGTGPDHSAQGRIQRMSASAKHPCGYFIQVTQGFKQKDAQDAQGSTFYDGIIWCKQTGEKVPVKNNDENGNAAADCR